MGTRILTVEDDERIRTSVRLALEDEGWTVEEAESGEDALNAFTREPADVVLIDIMLPGIDGFDLMPQIARSLPEVPIILMSAHGTQDLAIEAIRRGAYDYLAKPFQPAEIRLTLRKAEEREELRRRNSLLECTGLF